MPTSVYLDDEVLAWIDRESVRRGLSRNRFIYIVLKEAMAAREEWSEQLFAKLKDSACAENPSR